MVSAILIAGGSSLQGVLADILNWIDNKMGWAYMWVYTINFIFFIFILFSKYGRIRFGGPDAKPQYSSFEWGSMVFATAIDASILMLSMTDPLSYLQDPPYGAKPFSEQAYNLAHMLGQFNWGPMAWLMFSAPTVAVGYVIYNKHRRIQSISEVLTVLDGDQMWKKTMRQIVNLLIVFGIMGGVGADVGLEIPVVSNVLSRLTGISDNMMLKMELFFVLFVIFTFAVMRGLNGGIDKLSHAHIWTAILFLVIVLLAGPTVYILNSETNSIGLLIQKFIPMSMSTVPNGHPGFTQRETIFYWGWWLSYTPFMGLFIAKISRGRTIRQLLIGMLTYGAIGCMSFYAIFGGYSLWLQKTGTINLVHILNTQGQAAVISTVIASLPFKIIILALYCISCFIFLATTISSSAFVLSSFTSTKLKPGVEPSKVNKMTWVVIFIIFSFSLVLVGGFQTVQTFCTIAGFPIMFVAILVIMSVFKMITHDKSIMYPPRRRFIRRHTKKSATVERRRSISKLISPKNIDK